MQGLDFTVIAPYWDLLLTGAWWTTVLTVSAGALSFAGGILFAVIVLYAPAILAYPVRAFMWPFMGTPARSRSCGRNFAGRTDQGLLRIRSRRSSLGRTRMSNGRSRRRAAIRRRSSPGTCLF